MKKHKKIIAILLFVVGLIGLYGVYFYFQYGRFSAIRVEVVPSSYEFVADKQALVISWKEKETNLYDKIRTLNPRMDNGSELTTGWEKITYGKRYIATDSYRLLQNDIDNLTTESRDVRKLGLGEFWKVIVYDTSTENLARKEYDLLKAVRDYNPDYFPLYSGWTHFYSHNGQEYRSIALHKRGTPIESRMVLLNLKTGKIEEYPENYQSLETYKTISLLKMTNLKDHYQKNSLIELGRKELAFSNTIGNKASDWKLKSAYPKAYRLMAKEKGELYILSDSFDLKATVATYQLLLPKTKDLFDNLTVYGDYTKDGQDHVVNSYDELKTVLKEEYTNGQD